MRIALAGCMEAGKSTIAQYLADIYGFGVLSFSDKLKFNLIDIGIDPDRLFEKKDDTARELMQVYGQAMREQNPLHWVNFMMCGVDFGEELGTDGHVVDDLRFVNEAEALREEGFVLVRVNKISTVPPSYFTATSQHISENEWLDIDFDYTITAVDGALSELFGQVDDVINKIIKKGGE